MAFLLRPSGINDERMVIMKELTSPKSYRDVADIIGKSLGWVQLQKDWLLEHGFITRNKDGVSRYPWKLTKKGRDLLGDSHVGSR